MTFVTQIRMDGLGSKSTCIVSRSLLLQLRFVRPLVPSSLIYELHCADLEGIHAWGKGNYTPANYDQQWVKECAAMGCDPSRGITREVFKNIL